MPGTGNAQGLCQDRNDRAMQPQDCLNKLEVIRREITNGTWEPGLVFEFEKMQARKGHKWIYLDSLGVAFKTLLAQTV